MNVEKKGDDEVEQATSRPRNVEEAVGSHYALQVALQTIKERCQHLQKRLGIVEQENLRLRIENRRRMSDSVSTVTAEELENGSEDKVQRLEEKIAELTRTKSQLTHHLFMVATENKQLWNRLSQLTQANQNLGSHLSKISSTLSRHHSTSSISPSHSPPAPDPVEDSLEEISLKLIKSFLQEKTELEDQYAQMVEIQSDSYSVGGFGYLEEGDDAVAEDLKLHQEKLTQLRDLLREQRSNLKCALERGVASCCPRCKEKKLQLETDAEEEAEVESLRKWAAADPPEPPLERMCPMCGRVYNKAVPFKAFQKHVSDHFTEDDDTFSIINSFEVLT